MSVFFGLGADISARHPAGEGFDIDPDAQSSVHIRFETLYPVLEWDGSRLEEEGLMRIRCGPVPSDDWAEVGHGWIPVRFLIW